MKRWIFTILLFLVLGVIVNVAVAWGIAYWSDRDYYSPNQVASGATILELRIDEHRIVRTGWSIDVRRRIGDEVVAAEWHYGIGVSSVYDRLNGQRPEDAVPWWSDLDDAIYTVAGVPFPPHQSPERTKENFAFGWPLLTLWHGVQCVGWDVYEVWNGINLGQPTSIFNSQPLVLPLRPIWTGMVLNTAFYAAVLWFAFRGPIVLRRLIRIKRGRCPKCGYDLRGAPSGAGAGGCPECGWNRPSRCEADREVV